MTYQKLNLGQAGVSDQQRKSVFDALTKLSESYFKLIRRVEYSNGNSGDQETDDSFLDALWSSNLDEASAGNTKTAVLKDLNEIFADQLSPERATSALLMADRMLQVGVRVSGLRDVVSSDNDYSRYGPGWQSTNYSLINYGGVLRGLMELGFEIARTNPTVTNPESTAAAWIETLVKGGDSTKWTGAAMRSTAQGLSNWFDGFDKGYSQAASLPEGLDYAKKIVQASQLISNSNIRNNFRDTKLLGSAINWAGSYKEGLKDSYSIDGQGLFSSPFSEALRSNNLVAVAGQLENYYLWSENGAKSNEYEVPFSKLVLENGRTLFYFDSTARWTEPNDGILDAGNLTPGVDPQIGEGGLIGPSTGAWMGKIRIKRASDGRIETYAAATNLPRKIYIFSRGESLISDVSKQLANDRYIPLYLGDQVTSVVSLTFNKTDGKFPTLWLDKIFTARDLAIQAAPSKFAGEVKSLWDSVIKNPLLTGAGLAAMGAIHAFAPPVAVAIDASMMAFFGAKSMVHLGSFFIKAIGAQDREGLKAASEELLNFVGSAFESVVSGAGVFAAKKLTKGVSIADWFRDASTAGQDFLRLFTWDNIHSLNVRNTGGLVTTFFQSALNRMNPKMSQFLSYGNQAALDFFEGSGSQLVKNPIEGLKIFGEKWNRFMRIVDKLNDSPDVASFLQKTPKILVSVFDQGAESVDFLSAIINKRALDLSAVADILSRRSLSIAEVKRISDGSQNMALGLAGGVDGHANSGLLLRFSSKVGAPHYSLWPEWPAVSMSEQLIGPTIRQRMNNSTTRRCATFSGITNQPVKLKQLPSQLVVEPAAQSVGQDLTIDSAG
ncbi:MAG: hypothetical protein HC860_25620, partial [Alkalinema sp. RU_4_3]|nr:hypothetical protein [Alkalinema sp. RU_4_3]